MTSNLMVSGNNYYHREINKLGRLILLKYIVLTSAFFLLLPVLIYVPIALIEGEKVSLSIYYNNLQKDFSENIVVLIIVTVVVLFAILILGHLPIRQIILKNRNPLFVSAITFFVLWTIILVTITLIDCFQNASKYGVEGIKFSLMGMLI